MRILVTGATGFVGRALCHRLLAAGHTVRAAIRHGAVPLPKAIERVQVGDLGADTRWEAALRAVQVVVHLAARVHVMRDDAPHPLAEFRKVNTEGTENLARQAAAAGVVRLVYLSSVKVNGERTADPSGDPGRDRRGVCLPAGRACFTEDDAPQPQDAYGVSKWEAEQGLMAIARQTGMGVVIIRPPLVYGPGVGGNFAALLRWVRWGVPLPFASVDNRRSFVALENLTSFIGLCADPQKSPRAANELFLISDGDDVSTAELLRRVAQAAGKKARLIPVPANWLWAGARLLGKAALADRLLGSLVVDSSKARILLGWDPVVSMAEQLARCANERR